jgi:hypothetical protein
MTLNPELQRLARQRAAERGISFAEYIRRLVVQDIEKPENTVAPSAVSDLGKSSGSNIALHKDEMVGEAATLERHCEPSR